MHYRLATVAVAAATALAAAGAAHADSDSYLQYLRDHGQTVLPFMEGSWLTSGRMVCSELKEGLPREEILRQFTFGSDGNVGIDAAQQELCPETLH
jgi:hypothetical protein